MKNLNEFTILEKIGEGSFGKVFKIRNNQNLQVYVLKQVDLSLIDKHFRNTALLEAKILNQIKSEYIVNYHSSFLQNNLLHIIMQYCDGGDLATFLRKNKLPLKQQLIWKWLIQIASGLSDLHKKGILHRDIKALNIFLTKSQDIRIGDLGVARQLMGRFANTVIGTPYYLSPQMCQQRPYNQKTDIWAFGCLLYELTSNGKRPFQANNIPALTLKIITGKYNPISTIYSKSLRQIIKSCLKVDYRQRPSAQEILEKAMNITNMSSVVRNNKIEALQMPISAIDGIKNVKSLSKNKINKSRNKSQLSSDKNAKPINKIEKNIHELPPSDHRLQIKKNNAIKSQINKQQKQKNHRKGVSELPLPSSHVIIQKQKQFDKKKQKQKIQKKIQNLQNETHNTKTTFFEYEIPVFPNNNNKNQIDDPCYVQTADTQKKYEFDVQEEIQDNEPFTQDINNQIQQYQEQFPQIQEDILSKKHYPQSSTFWIERKKKQLLENICRKQTQIFGMITPGEYERLLKMVSDQKNLNKINEEKLLLSNKRLAKTFISIVKEKIRVDHLMEMMKNNHSC